MKAVVSAPETARYRAWKRFLVERSGPMQIALSAVSERGGKLHAKAKAKAGRRELKERELPKYLMPKLAQAKLKEWAGWTHYESVEILPPKEVHRLPRYVQAVPTRFVVTDRNETLRTKTNQLPVDLKARLVVLGNLEKDVTFRRDAPTGSLLAQQLVMAWAASGGGDEKTGPRRRERKV